MTITINGQPRKFEARLDIATLLNREGFADKKVAVALNGYFVPKAAHASTKLNNNDSIEIVAPMQGG